MGVFPSGQWGQTVNLLLSASVVRIHPRPPRERLCRNTQTFFFCKFFEVSPSRVDSSGCGAVAEDGAKTVRCNSDDRCQRQMQGGAVGTAASGMRVPPKARRSRWEPRPRFLFTLRGSRYPPAHQTRKIRTCFRLEKGSDFSFSSGMIAIRIFNSLTTTANCMPQ